MLVIVGLIVLLVAAIATIEGVRSNAGVAHPPTETTRVRSAPVKGDRHGVPLRDHGRCGCAALDWLPAHRGHHARRSAIHLAFVNQVRDTRLEHQQRVDTVTGPPTPTDQATTRRRRSPLRGALVARSTANDHGWLTVSASRGL